MLSPPQVRGPVQLALDLRPLGPALGRPAGAPGALVPYRVQVASGPGQDAPRRWLGMLAPSHSLPEARRFARQRFRPLRVVAVRGAPGAV